jgi:hypothetical protein
MHRLILTLSTHAGLFYYRINLANACNTLSQLICNIIIKKSMAPEESETSFLVVI